MTSSRRSWQKSMSKSGIDTRSGLRKRSNSKPKRNGSRSVMVSAQDHRACARAAPGTHRYVLGFGPLDELGDDQEISREAHRDDGAELEFQALAIRLRRLLALRRVHPRLKDLGIEPP